MFTIGELETAIREANELTEAAIRTGLEAHSAFRLWLAVERGELEYCGSSLEEVYDTFQRVQYEADQVSSTAMAAMELVQEIESKLDSADDLTARSGRVPFWA